MSKTNASLHVDVQALARALVPLLIPPLVAALADSNATPARARRMPLPPPPPPRRLWTAKEAADWEAAAPEYRIVWDEHGKVLSMDNLHDKLSPGQHVWHIVGWNESRSRAWLQLDAFEWSDEYVLFQILRSDGKRPNPDADAGFFERWQAWCVLHPSSDAGPIFPWRRPRKKRPPK